MRQRGWSLLQGEKAASLAQGRPHAGGSNRMGGNVGQIAVIAGGSVSRFAGGALLAIDQANMQAAPRRVVDIAGRPVTPRPASSFPVRRAGGPACMPVLLIAG